MKLNVRPQDLLDWNVAGSPEVFEFDLGFDSSYFSLDDELQFNARAKALEHFTESLWPNHPNTRGILYRGSLDFSPYLFWDERREGALSLYLEKRPQLGELHGKRLFSIEVFVYYFQMLSHKLPDEMPLKLILDPENCGSFAEKLHLLSPERFEHFDIEHPHQSTSSRGVLFPSDRMCSKEVLQKIDKLLEKEGDLRAVYEPILTEQWDGLDELHVFSETLTETGKRGLLGFEAAGGKIISG